MGQYQQSSGSKPKPGCGQKSLYRHIFVRVAFPVGIVFFACFSLLDHLVQIQLSDHIEQELAALDAQAQRNNVGGDARLGRVLSALAEEADVEFAVQIEKLARSLDEDVYAVAGVDKKAIVGMRREGTSLKRITGQVPVPDTRLLTAIDGQYYFLTSFPLLRGGKLAGWIVVGRHWLREVPLDQGLYLLSNKGKVVQTAGSLEHVSVAIGTATPSCIGGKAVCEVDINSSTVMLLRSSVSAKDQEIEVYLVRSFDLQASPVLGMIRSTMLAGAVLSILGALGLAMLTGRAIAGPLRNLTNSCVRAQETGLLSAIEIPESRIEEVSALGKTLQSAMRSIEAGQTELTDAYFQFMGAIVALLDARDPYTAGHSHRVSAYSEALALEFGLPPQDVDDIRIAALLHDIGKIGVPDEVLRKHGRLTNEEFELMKRHPSIGRRVLEKVDQFGKYLDAVELHHENLDGTGYPLGLREVQIPMSARIVKVADVYDALSTDRPYRKRMSPDEVHRILRNGAGTEFDGRLVEVFLARCLPKFEVRSGLEQLHLAIGESGPTPAAVKAVGA